MSNNLLFDFVINKKDKTITVKREFAAEVPLVWAAWTQPELLDQWWAPRPYRAVTKTMDFREGGYWHYYMVGPDKVIHWCRADYQKIAPMKYFSVLNAFCDEAGIDNPELPHSSWTNTFSGEGHSTFVEILINYEELTDLEKIIEMGFREGLTAAMVNLDQYIETQFKLRSQLRVNQTPRVCTYLNFPGNTEEAFLFYRDIFKSAFSGNGIQRFGDIPAEPGNPPIADSVKNMVIHVELPITGQHVLMGTDAPREMGFTVTQGNNMHLYIEPGSKEETERIFEALSSGGQITMPLQNMFWGAYFGSLTDRFGINWMISNTSKEDANT